MVQNEKPDRKILEIDISKLSLAIRKSLECVPAESDSEWTEEELENYHKFLLAMAELEWPAFLEGDTAFHAEIASCMEKDDVDGIVNSLYDYYDDPLFLKWVEDRFEESEVIRPERLPVIREAFLLYQLGYYYGAVAILIPQIEGILTDIDRYIACSGNGYKKKNIDLIDSRYRVSKTNEKGKVVKVLLETKDIDGDGKEYDYLIGYLRMKVLKDNLSEKELSMHPNRHAFCHGEQCNYGTKEHALKAILCIDALEYVASVISESSAECRIE